MPPILRKPALLAALLPLALAARAADPEPTPDPAPPAVLCQLEIRGLSPFLDAATRITSPVLPADCIPDLFKQTFWAFLGQIPRDLFGTTDAPIRAIVLDLPDGSENLDTLYDFPVADGDPAAFFDRLSATWTDCGIPEAYATVFPSGSRLFKMPGWPDGTFAPHVLFLPHGDRMAALPVAPFLDLPRLQPFVPTPPADVAAFLDSVPRPSVEGQLAYRIDSPADIADLLYITCTEDGQVGKSPQDDFRANVPYTSLEYGIGLDSSDRVRHTDAVDLRPGSATARLQAGIGAPASPCANVILSPDALAAFSAHVPPATEADLSAWLAEQLPVAAITIGTFNSRPLLEKWGPRAVALGAALDRHRDGDISFVLLPPAPGAACPWALYLSSPDAPAFLDALPDLVNGGIAFLYELFADAIQCLDGGLLPEDSSPFDPSKINLRLLPVADFTIADTPYTARQFDLILTDPEKRRGYVLYTFRAAAAGPALVLADLPDSALVPILRDLRTLRADVDPALFKSNLPDSVFATYLTNVVPVAAARPSLAALPAFAEAYGPADPAAATAYIRPVPALRAVLQAARARFNALAARERAADAAEARDPTIPYDTWFDRFPAPLHTLLSCTENLPPLTLAATERPLPGTTRVVTTLSLPLSNLHAWLPLLQSLPPFSSHLPD